MLGYTLYHDKHFESSSQSVRDLLYTIASSSPSPSPPPPPSSSSSSAFSDISLGVTIFGEIIAYVIFNPTIEVVTFRLRGWCMLSVYVVAI